MKSYKARGIVLHSVKYGESSQIVYLLTNTRGRETYMIQGARGGKARGGRGSKMGLFQPMFVVDFEGLESPKMQMHRMREVQMAVALKSTPFEVRKSTISLFMAEVLYRLIKEVEANSPLFDFVYNSIVELDRMEEGVANFHLWFLVRLSSFLGFYPGNEYQSNYWFDVEQGLFTSIKPTHRFVMSRHGAEILSRLMEIEVAQLGELKLSREDRSEFMNSIILYFEYHLDTVSRIRSIDILREVF